MSEMSAEETARTYTPVDCDGLATKLNSRPRKRLGFKTPEECYALS